jgi:GT2 family glycosyltransferase
MKGPTRYLAPSPATGLEPLSTSPTFSIVVPAYQAAATIAASVSSALAQVYPAHEVIIVDDGSTDDLDGALRPFGDRIRLLRKPNGGHGSALNMGARAATGDFYAILDADDAYHPRRLQALAELAAIRPDLDLVTTDARFVLNGEVVGTFHEFNAFEVDDQRSAILRSCFVGGWPAVRLGRLRSIGLFDESLWSGTDWDCWLRLILDGGRAGLVDVPYYDYHLRSGSLSSKRVPSLWARVRLLEKAANASLTRDERHALARSLRQHRTRAVLAEADAALADADMDRRRIARRALVQGISMRARLACALAAMAPAAARRLVSRDIPPVERFAA